jgi:hypothetical protein
MVMLNGPDAFTLTRPIVLQMLRNRGTYEKTQVNTGRIAAYAPQDHIKLKYDKENDTGTLQLQLIALDNVKRVRVDVYIGVRSAHFLELFKSLPSKVTKRRTGGTNRTVGGSSIEMQPLSTVDPADDETDPATTTATTATAAAAAVVVVEEKTKASDLRLFPAKKYVYGTSKSFSMTSASHPGEQEAQDTEEATEGGDGRDGDKGYLTHEAVITISGEALRAAKSKKRCDLVCVVEVSVDADSSELESKTSTTGGAVDLVEDYAQYSLLPFTTGGALSASYSCTKQAIRMQDTMLEMKQVYGLENAVTETPDCLACMSDPVDIILLPCRHVCVCKDCHAQCNACPICRSPIKSYMQFVQPDKPKML